MTSKLLASRIAVQNCATVSARRTFSTSTSRFNNNEIPLPLAGLRVLELGQLIAGPFCGQLLSHFGADVIKVEPPQGGDPLRKWRELDENDGISPWWRSLNRNKRSIGIDLRNEKGQKMAKQLALQSDVVIENFKPGVLEKFGMAPEDMYKLKPDLIFTRISGWGQNGPMSKEGGFAAVAEAFAGFRYVNGWPDESGQLAGAPVRPNISLGDSLAGTSAALGTLLALIARGKMDSKSVTRTGQTVDVAIYESVMNMMEGIVPNYDRTGLIRGPSGSGVTGIVPTAAFPCKEANSFVIIGGNNDSLYVRLMEQIGRQDLTGDAYKTNADRVRKQAEIEQAITEWTSKRSVDEVLEAMQKARVPCGPINSVKEIVENEHIQARGMIEDVPVHSPATNKSWSIKMPGLSPVLEYGPKKTRWAGPDLGQHTDEILKELGIQGEEIASMRKDGIIV